MEPVRRFPPFLQGVVVFVVAGLILVAVGITAFQSVRATRAAETSGEVIEAIREQTAIILCVLLIEPVDRTPANIAACKP